MCVYSLTFVQPEYEYVYLSLNTHPNQIAIPSTYWVRNETLSNDFQNIYFS